MGYVYIAISLQRDWTPRFCTRVCCLFAASVDHITFNIPYGLGCSRQLIVGYHHFLSMSTRYLNFIRRVQQLLFILCCRFSLRFRLQPEMSLKVGVFLGPRSFHLIVKYYSKLEHVTRIIYRLILIV